MKSAVLKSTNAAVELFAKPFALNLLIAISAQICVPTPWVPVTCQSLAILCIGLIFRPQTAALAVLYYISEIAIGLPFAAGLKAGLPVLFGPTAGFLLGFLIAVTVGSNLVKNTKSFFTVLISATVMIACIYIPGVLWLSTFVGFKGAIASGFLPFLPEIPAFITLATIPAYHLKNR